MALFKSEQTKSKPTEHKGHRETRRSSPSRVIRINVSEFVVFGWRCRISDVVASAVVAVVPAAAVVVAVVVVVVIVVVVVDVVVVVVVVGVVVAVVVSRFTLIDKARLQCKNTCIDKLDTIQDLFACLA